MSTSEQDLQSQIARMREAIRSVRASARTGTIVRVVGVVVGFLVVGFFVWKFLSLGQAAAEPGALAAVLRSRVQMLQLERGARTVAEEVAPVVGEEGLKLVRELELPKVASEQLQIMMKDLEPVVRRELERVTPRLQGLLEDQREETSAELRKLLEDKIAARFVQSIESQGIRLESQAGMTEEKLAEIVANLQAASVEALQAVIKKRTGNLEEEMLRIWDLLDEVPPLREDLSQEGLLLQFRDVLVALLKHSLPDYDISPFEFADFRRPLAPPHVIRELEEKARQQSRRGAEEARKPDEEAAQ